MHIGVDIGGTFTDFVIYDPKSGDITTFKTLSTPRDPAEAMLSGLSQIKKVGNRRVIHGSTVATNALLERKGARTALITTKGFRDVLQIGRQNRENLYGLHPNPPNPLIPRDLRFELAERVDQSGQVVTEIKIDNLFDLIKVLKSKNVESVAVCFLFSFLFPDHEEKVEDELIKAGFNTSISNKILPEFREFERMSTTTANAYVSPVISNYLSKLEKEIVDSKLQIMQSNGGSISPAEARKNAVRCILSGPAGGVVGAKMAANLAGFDRIISFDMGGTSTDVSLIDGELRKSTESEIGGLPIGIPILDIHTVGAGGGSIAAIDIGGSLIVGPESAGANPGPACYGKGNKPTTTDANLVLDRLDPEYFLGGEMPLDRNASLKVISELSDQLGLTPIEVAKGIIQVANALMERALRVISIEKGHDPNDFTLVSFGGAGGLHAVDLARSLNIPKILIPPQASTLSALGMLLSDVVKDYAKTVMLSGKTSYETLIEAFSPLIIRAKKDLQSENMLETQIQLESSLDLRYEGQSFELNIPLSQDFLQDFHNLHNSVYGYHDNDLSIEIVNIRVNAVGKINKPELKTYQISGNDPSHALMFTKTVVLDDGEQKTQFFRGEMLKSGNYIKGPAMVIRSDTTILIEKNDTASVDKYLNLIISVTPGKGGQYGV